jgi:hypothetical protein
MKNIKDIFINHLVFFGVLLFVIIASGMYKYGDIKKDYYLRELGSISILYDTTPNFVIGPNDYIEHNKIMLSVLQNREMSLSSELTAKNNVIWQMRAIYFAILAGLLTLLLTKGSNNKWLYLIILILIIINYLFDVHLEDQYNRKKVEFGLTKGSTDVLLSSMTYEKKWYDLSYTKFQEKLTEGFSAKYNCERWRRKFVAACQLLKNIERIVYYIIPFFGVYLLLLILIYNDKVKGKNFNNSQTSWPSSA